ncbi:MAG TPA: hypothetical protein VJV05_01520 [Pyrinomonadaceae bacterium]|nr:hypothetical protein [Pyrinomonadaceae bacterium]
MRNLITTLAILVFGLPGGALRPVISAAQGSPAAARVSARALDTDIRDFAAREIAAHFGNITKLNPPPDRVFSAQAVGDFSWGSFARALAAQAVIGGNRTIAGKDTARAIAEIGLHEARQGGKSFAQLYSTQALRHYGTDLEKNAVWLSMNESERREWRSLLDPTRFYDPKKRAVINLPENYLGVAARVAAMSYEMGVLKDRSFVDNVVEKAAEQFTNGALYADDNPPTGRYDRYSNEYARFCWDAADIAGRQDIKEKLKPTLKRQMALWWDLVSPAGYGYNWGRSQGLVSYLDTLEIAAFLGANREFRPAPIEEIAALYNQAWNWIRADYNDQTHMFRVFDYGRGNYSYINPSREWQQTGTGLGKIIVAHNTMMKALDAENITSFPTAPTLADVARFEFFAKSTAKQEGVWLFRRGKLRFALPITVGTKPAISDYLPIPFGTPGFAAPVEEVYPALVPFITLADGKTYAASDGADEITPGSDGSSLQIVNRKWALVGSKSGERLENGLATNVEWQVTGNKLTRRETLEAQADVVIKKWRVAIPTTASRAKLDGPQKFLMTGREGQLAISASGPKDLQFDIEAVGEGRLGKGVLGAVPIHLIAETGEKKLSKGEKIVWEISFEILK